ncbi:transmembrane channel-like protein 3 [Ostrinia furnacalis]|uniref:transmembrane channel-like protein 3 n=1 Tax=Ostrinia furnacalis TaxID=93504 RepID=UPI00103EBB63|nr:transmembrane channel-like protein 3 [Ostrinia furnacalis]
MSSILNRLLAEALLSVLLLAEGSEDEDYSASLSAVLRQRRASVRRSRKGRARRPSSPFLADETRPRRRSSVFTTSSGDTAISMEESQPAVVTQEQIFENIHLHKEVLGSVKQQPLGMRRKLKIVHQAKAYIKRHEGQLQERLAQSKSTRDIYARFNILLATKWQQMKREAANTSNLLIPWELRIKEIESHFGSVVASYFTFLRWLFWVNLVIGFILLVFVIVPEYLTANPKQDGERKIIMEEERSNATNLLMLWEFEGVLKFSPIFYGYYSNVERPQYRMPLAYFLTGLAVYIYSFVAILRKMAENSRMSKLSEKEDECIFSWKLFTGWDFMIGNTETAHNRIASVILGFKEALLEEAEKKKDLRNWRIISLRAIVNICVVILLAVSAYAVVTVVSRSDDNSKPRSWWRENETTVVVTVISITFPVFFELLGFLEHYHPRKQLRLQLARIMLLNLLNLYSLIFALFSKIEGMSDELNALKPVVNMTVNTTANNTMNITEAWVSNLPTSCSEERKKLLKLCWETMFGQELVKLTMMDLVFVLLGTLFMDFFRALFVRYMNRCWCWDLEKKFPEYGDFKIAENILHLINNQGMVWMGMFFSPGLVVLNVVKLMIMMYLRSWAVMTCNVPHEVVFRVSKSNNFYLALLLTMLFLCVLPVGYTIVWVRPSWHCGPFSEYEKIYYILTNNIYKILPKSLNFALEYIASPAIVIPLLVLLILIIYYLTSLTNSLREANNDLKIQLRRERTEERRKMFQLADTRRRVGSSAMDNTPFARWKKALPTLPISKSIDSDDRKTITADDNSEPSKAIKKRGGIFAKIVGLALDKKTDVETVPEVNNVSQSSNNVDDETDTDFHETLPKEVLKIKDIIFKHVDNKKKSNVEFNIDDSKPKLADKGLKVKIEKEDDRSEKIANIEKQKQDLVRVDSLPTSKKTTEDEYRGKHRMDRKQTSESSTQSRQSDSIGSVIPVITISTTESDEETLQSKKSKGTIKKPHDIEDSNIAKASETLKRMKKSSSDLKSLRRQSSVESITEKKLPKDNHSEGGHKYQYSL